MRYKEISELDCWKPETKNNLEDSLNDRLYIEEEQTVAVDLSSETMEARRQWNNIFNVVRKYQPMLPYPIKISFMKEEKWRYFQMKGSCEKSSKLNLFRKKSRKKCIRLNITRILEESLELLKWRANRNVNYQNKYTMLFSSDF